MGALTGQTMDVSAALTFEFGDVTVSTVSIILLDKYLNTSDIDPTAKQIQDLMIQGNASVTTAVARTKKYIVSTQDDHGVDISANVPVIQNVAGGKLGISTAGSNNTKVVYEGPHRLRLACRRSTLDSTTPAGSPDSARLLLEKAPCAGSNPPLPAFRTW